MRIASIEYAYDPDAAKKWFDLWIDIVQEELMKDVNKPIEDQELEEARDEINRGVLPEFDETARELSRNAEVPGT